MNFIVELAVDSVKKSKTAFCKFISPNDAGKTDSHQVGFYIPKNSIPLMFDSPGIKGQNKDRFITIKWQGDFETTSRFIYYGQGTRNEYRLTRFGKSFPFLSDSNVGDLLVLCHIEKDYYEGFVLQSDEDFEDFFASLNITAIQTNCLISKTNLVTTEERLLKCFNAYLSATKKPFPSSADLALNARSCYINSYDITRDNILANPDENFLRWIESEYQLFKLFENSRYKDIITTPFQSVEDLIGCANTILNRRKSRAGKSLEHHLEEVFRIFDLQFEAQPKTEDNKKPDFIFPGSVSYHNMGFNSDKLIFLAAKTTCKDRWRQILREADRIEEKHLFTLQQGISVNQFKEMQKEKVILVVPKFYVSCFPKEYQNSILDLEDFISMVTEKQN